MNKEKELTNADALHKYDFKNMTEVELHNIITEHQSFRGDLYVQSHNRHMWRNAMDEMERRVKEHEGKVIRIVYHNQVNT